MLVPRVGLGFTTGVIAVLYRLRGGFRSRTKAYAALAVAVAVTFAVVLVLAAGAVRTLTAADRYAESYGRYGASIEQSGGKPRTAEVATLPAVDDVQSATFVFGGLAPEGTSPEAAADALVFAGSPGAFATRVVDGRAPDPAEAGEFAATRSFLASRHASLGDRFDLWVIPQRPAAELGFDAGDQAVRLLTATLVGVIDGPSELEDGSPLTIFPPALLDGDVGVSATMSVATLTPGSTIGDLRTQLDGLPDASQFAVDRGDWVSDEVRAAINAQGQALAILAAIAGIATMAVVGQLLSRQFRMAEAERRQLRSIGMTRGQVVADQLVHAAVPVVVGTSLAVGLAYAASGLFPRGFVLHVEPDPGRRFDALVLLPIALAVAVALLTWVLVAVAASEDERPGAARARSWDEAAKRLPVRVATALRFAFVRQARDSTRPKAALVGMAVIVAVLAGALTFGASLDGLVERPARWGGDFDFSLGQGGGELPDAVRAELENDPDVAGASLFGAVVARAGTEGFDVAGVLPVVGSTEPHFFEGRPPMGDDEIVVGRVAARRLGVGVGDELVVTGPAGDRTLRVTGIAVLPPIEGGDGVGEGGLVTFEGLRRLDPSAVTSAAGVRLRAGASPDAAAQRIAENTGMTVGRFARPSAIVNVARARSVPYVVAGVLVVLALLNLAHHLILSARRRRRDLAVLRALGADGRWITGVVHWQASLFTIAAVALGAPFGIAAGRITYRTFVDRIGAVDAVTLPLATFALALVALVALTNVVAAPSARRARRPPPSGILAGE